METNYKADASCQRDTWLAELLSMGFSTVPAWQAMEASNFSSLQAAMEILLMAGDVAVSEDYFTQESRKKVHNISERHETLKEKRNKRELLEEGNNSREVEERLPREVKEEKISIGNREINSTEFSFGNSSRVGKYSKDVEADGKGMKKGERENEEKEMERNVSLEKNTKGLKSVPGLRRKGGSVLNSVEKTFFSKENSSGGDKESREEFHIVSEKKRTGQSLENEGDHLGREKKRRVENNGEKGEREENCNIGEGIGNSRKVCSVVKQEPEDFSPLWPPKEVEMNPFLVERKVERIYETEEKKNFEVVSEGQKTEDPDWLRAAKAVMQKHFGFSYLKPFQIEALSGWAEGRDTFVLAATGSGKSLCFQLPALITGKVTVVISPLISLMRDQCHALAKRGISAAFLGSGQPDAGVEGRAMEGFYDIVYVCPESLPRLLGALQNLAKSRGIALFAVDEAHCISKWGHDFRPHYRQLSLLKKNFGLKATGNNVAPIMALTATATLKVREDILDSLGMRNLKTQHPNFQNPKLVLTTFYRPNLIFSVRHSKTKNPNSYGRDFKDLIEECTRKRKKCKEPKQNIVNNKYINNNNNIDCKSGFIGGLGLQSEGFLNKIPVTDKISFGENQIVGKKLGKGSESFVNSMSSIQEREREKGKEKGRWGEREEGGERKNREERGKEGIEEGDLKINTLSRNGVTMGSIYRNRMETETETEFENESETESSERDYEEGEEEEEEDDEDCDSGRYSDDMEEEGEGEGEGEEYERLGGDFEEGCGEFGEIHTNSNISIHSTNEKIDSKSKKDKKNMIYNGNPSSLSPSPSLSSYPQKLSTPIWDMCGMGSFGDSIFSSDGAGKERPQKRGDLRKGEECEGGEEGEEGVSIIYVPTRKEVDRLSKFLSSQKVKAAGYHAGLPKTRLREVHDKFHDGTLQVVVATIAFGMGIDKPNVRKIFHYGWPQSLESYYQEAGRAGRDGQISHCVLLCDMTVLPSLLPSRRDALQSKNAVDMLWHCYRYGISTAECRITTLLNYFGENFAQKTCGRCDICVGGPPAGKDLTAEGENLLKQLLNPTIEGIFREGVNVMTLKGFAHNLVWWRGFGRALLDRKLLRDLETEVFRCRIPPINRVEVTETGRLFLQWRENGTANFRPTDATRTENVSSFCNLSDRIILRPTGDMIEAEKIPLEDKNQSRSWGRRWADPEFRREMLNRRGGRGGTGGRGRGKRRKGKGRKRGRGEFSTVKGRLNARMMGKTVKKRGK